MLVKELRQGMRARGFVMPFASIHLLAVLAVAVEFAVKRAAATGIATGSAFATNGHIIFWGLMAVVVAVIFPLRSLGSMTSDVHAGQWQLVLLTGMNRWSIVRGKWLAQMSLAGLMLISLLPYGIARYFFGGVELIANLAAFTAVLCASGAISALVIGGSSFRSQKMRIFIILLALAYIGFPTLGLLLLSKEMGRLSSVSESVAWFIGAASVLEFYAFFTFCGLQMARAEMRTGLKPWEYSPTRIAAALFIFSPILWLIGMICAIVLPLWGAALTLWVAFLDRDRRGPPPPIPSPPVPTQ